MTAQKLQKLDVLMDKLIELGAPGNDILVYHDGKEVYRSFRGYSDIENKIPMNGKERYNIYSSSKPITCTAALQLVEKGLLSLDEPLCTYIPEFKNMYIQTEDAIKKAKNYITVRHLFTMTAGFTYNTISPALMEARKNTDGKCPTVETIKYLSQEPLAFEPGTKWHYSLCHDVLAAVVEVISGIRFGEYVRQNIFEPLGMTHSTFLLPEDELDTICAQYRLDKETNTLERKSNEIQNFKLGTEYESGGAGAISTVEDYIKFTEALRIGDVILSKEMTEKMSADAMAGVDISGYWTAARGYSYGLGVRCPKPGDTNICDFGWGGAAGAYMIVDIKNKCTVSYGQHVLNNSSGDGHTEISKVLREG